MPDEFHPTFIAGGRGDPAGSSLCSANNLCVFQKLTKRYREIVLCWFWFGSGIEVAKRAVGCSR